MTINPENILSDEKITVAVLENRIDEYLIDGLHRNRPITIELTPHEKRKIKPEHIQEMLARYDDFDGYITKHNVSEGTIEILYDHPQKK